MKNNFKKVLTRILLISVLIWGLVPFSVFADSKPDVTTKEETDYIKLQKEMSEEEKKFHKEFFDFYGQDEKEVYNTIMLIGKLFTKNDDLPWYGQYLFFPGNAGYIEDVENSVWVSDRNVEIDKTVTKYDYKRFPHPDTGRKRWTVCFFDEPQNLLNHNCDIPSIGTDVVQNLFGWVYKTGIHGGARTTSVSNFGFGVPLGFSENNPVPYNISTSPYKHTALEMFGYDLYYTSYYGEWDKIEVQTNARLMANVGFFNKMKVFGIGLLDGISQTLKNVVTNFSLNPLDWIGWFTGVVDGTVRTTVDTVDLYIVSSNRWNRNAFANTLYNSYYLSSKELMEMTAKLWKDHFKKYWLQYAKEDPAVKLFFKFVPPTDETYFNPYWDAIKFPECLKNENCPLNKIDELCLETYEVPNDGNNPNPTVSEIVGCKVWHTPESYFPIYKEKPEVKSFFDSVLEIKNPRSPARKMHECYTNSNTNDELLECWKEPHQDYGKTIFDFKKPNMIMAMSKLRTSFFKKYPQLKAQGVLGHLICANEEGDIPYDRDQEGFSGIKWVYKKYNNRTEGEEQEYLTEGCLPIRPSIEGAFTGTGDYESKDTRYLHWYKNKKSFIQSQGESNIIANIGRWFASFHAKLTNTILNFSFDNLLESLGINELAVNLINRLKQGIFFPLLGLCFFGTSLYLLFKYTSVGLGFFKVLFSLLIITFIGTVLMTFPEKFVKLVDEYPSAFDRYMAESVLQTYDNEKELTSDILCSATGPHKGIRTMQCLIWRFSVFEPYIRDQWGTKLDNLDSSNLRGNGLVGNGTVNMGGGQTVQNWGLWQLSKMKSGSITSYDPQRPTGITSKALYKLVDLQAGPNYAAGRDTKYFDSWSGVGIERSSNLIFAWISSFILMIVVIGLGLVKIETSLLLLIKIMMLPLVLLSSLLPNSQSKLSEYFLDLFMIFIRRIFVTLLLSVVLLILTFIYTSDYSFSGLAVISSLFLIATKMYYKEIIEKFVGLNEFNETGSLLSKFNPSQFIPKSLKQKMYLKKASIEGAITGGISGFGVGLVRKMKGEGKIFQSVKDGMSLNRRIVESREFRGQRKQGFGMSAEYSQIKEKLKQPKEYFKKSDTQRKLEKVHSKLITENKNYSAFVNSPNVEQSNLAKQELIKNKKLQDIIEKVQRGHSVDQEYYKALYKMTQSLSDENIDKKVSVAKEQINKIYKQPKEKTSLGINEKYDELKQTLSKEKKKFESDQNINSVLKKVYSKLKEDNSNYKISISMLNSTEAKEAVLEIKKNEKMLGLISKIQNKEKVDVAYYKILNNMSKNLNDNNFEEKISKAKEKIYKKQKFEQLSQNSKSPSWESNNRERINRRTNRQEDLNSSLQENSKLVQGITENEHYEQNLKNL